MASSEKGGKNAAQQVNPESDDVQAQKVTSIEADGVNVDLSLDEGTVYADPNELIVDASDPSVVGFDQGGVYLPKDTGVIATPVKARRASGGSDSRAVFTATRSPELKVALTSEGDDGVRRRTGRWIKFNAGKAVVESADDAKALEALKIPGVFREPSGFLSESPDSDRFFTHKGTGFRTLSKEAYEDWVNNSEWSAVPSANR
jgi:hypothetical protein